MGEIKRLQEENGARLRALADKGIGIPSDSVAALRKELELRAIYKAVVPKDQQAAVDLEFETVMSKQIDSIEKQVEASEARERISKLTQGVPGVIPFPKSD